MKPYWSIPLLTPASANPKDQHFCLSSWGSLVSGALVGHPQAPILHCSALEIKWIS